MFKWFLLPSQSQNLTIGQQVYLRPKGAADRETSRNWRIVTTNTVDADHVELELDGEARVGAAGRSSKHARVSSIYPIYQRDLRHVLVCADTDTFRRFASSQVSPGDVVLEVGASSGETTTRLLQAVSSSTKQGRVIAVELNESLAERAKARCARDHPHLTEFTEVHCLDCLSNKEALLAHAQRAGVVFLDIGGDRNSDTVVVILSVLMRCGARLVVVKSRALACEMAERLSVGADGALGDGAKEWFDGRVDSAVASIEGSNGSRMQIALGGLEAKEASGAARRLGHPLQHPKKLFEGLEICRYFNFKTCKKKEECPYDHAHCHTCGKPGHRALDCSDFDAKASDAAQLEPSEGRRS